MRMELSLNTAIVGYNLFFGGGSHRGIRLYVAWTTSPIAVFYRSQVILRYDLDLDTLGASHRRITRWENPQD